MDYKTIRSTIEEDYNNVLQARGSSRVPKQFYYTFIKALEELHNAVSPFITDKDQFVDHLHYIKDRVNPDVYDTIVTYCKDKLEVDL